MYRAAHSSPFSPLALRSSNWAGARPTSVLPNKQLPLAVTGQDSALGSKSPMDFTSTAIRMPRLQGPNLTETISAPMAFVIVCSSGNFGVFLGTLVTALGADFALVGALRGAAFAFSCPSTARPEASRMKTLNALMAVVNLSLITATSTRALYYVWSSGSFPYQDDAHVDGRRGIWFATHSSFGSGSGRLRRR